MPPNLIPITTLTDPRVAAYTNLKERDLSREGTSQVGRFIAEGELVVRRLLHSSYATESIFAAADRVARILPDVPGDLPVYVADHSLLNQVLGFKFHSGIMACGLRGPSPTIDQIAERWTTQPVTLLVLPEVSNTDNMGSLLRIASAFGVDAVVVGEKSCDPFYRQSVRVSMGNIFSVPIVRSTNLHADLRRLRDHWTVELLATVVDPHAEPLARAQRTRRIALLLGNEAQGLSEQDISLCDRSLTIPMHHGTDSVNVSVAAGIFLYHFTQYAQER